MPPCISTLRGQGPVWLIAALLLACDPGPAPSTKVAPGSLDTAWGGVFAPDTAPPAAGPGTDTDAPPNDTDAPPTDTDEPPTSGGTGTPPTPSGVSLCFPGISLTYAACEPVVDHSGAWGSDYAYPAPLGGSPQYAAPSRFVDLNVTPSSLAVAPNFTLGELAQAWKGQFAVVQPHAVERLQDVRDSNGGPVSVTSGYRSPGYNAGVGGVIGSRHQYGDGFDLYPSNGDISGLGAICTAQGASYVGLYSGHVHCDWRNDTLDAVLYPSGPVPFTTPDAQLPIHSGHVVQHGALLTAPAGGFDEGEPLREWTFMNAQGQVLATSTGATASPPDGATLATVRIGGQLTRQLLLTPHTAASHAP